MAGALNKKEAKKRCAEFALRMIFVYEDVSHTVMFHTNMQGYKLGWKGKTYNWGETGASFLKNLSLDNEVKFSNDFANHTCPSYA